VCPGGRFDFFSVSELLFCIELRRVNGFPADGWLQSGFLSVSFSACKASQRAARISSLSSGRAN
jgi:hypothetical protein